MYDFGFLPKTLPFLALVYGYEHKLGDMYDPDAVNLGNSNVSGCKNGNIIYKTASGDTSSRLPDWLYLKDVH